MARTKQRPECPIYSIVRYQPSAPSRGRRFENLSEPKSSWLHKQPNTPRILQSFPSEEMKKILKYYPKKISSLKSITLAYSCELMGESEKLYRRIIPKYSKHFFRYFCLDLDQDKTCPSTSLFSKSLHNVQVLSIHSTGPLTEQDSEHLPQILKHNKFLSRLQFRINSSHDGVHIKLFEYLKNLRRLQVHDVPGGTPIDWRRSLPKVELLTIFSKLDKKNVRQLFEGLEKMKSLKKLNCEFKISDNRVLERIPFDDLKIRNIAYDLRIVTSDRNPEDVNLTILPATDFLGISQKNSSVYNSLHNPFQRSSIDLQRQSKNLFFLEGVKQSSYDHIFKAFPNITTLDLLLNKENPLSITGLNHLVNLRHLSLDVYLEDGFAPLWNVLTNFAQQHKNLTYLSLDLGSQDIIPQVDCKGFGLFLNALKDSLTSLLLCMDNSDFDEFGIEIFAAGILNLEKLKSFCLSFQFCEKEDFREFLQKVLNTLASRGLEELTLDLAEDDMTMEFLESSLNGATKLATMLLEVNLFEKNFDFSKVFSHLRELKELELITRAFTKEDWKALVKSLLELSNLEILKVASKNVQFSFDEIGVRGIIENHPNLKLIAMGDLSYKSKFLRVFVKKQYFYNIDAFLSRFEGGLLDLIDYKIYYI